MAKRFTDTAIWNREWFMDLSPTHKCLVRYLFDNCDACGVWKPNWKLASLHIGAEVNMIDLTKIPKDQFEVLDNGKILMVDFIKFQYNKLSKECRPHIPVLYLLEKHGIINKFYHLIEDSGSSVKALRKRLTDQAKKTVFEADDYQCQYCGDRPGLSYLFIDHIVSLSAGGDNAEENLTSSCKSCNSKKHDDDVFEFINKHNISPLNNLSKKLNTLFKKNNTLQEKDKEQYKEMEKEKETVKDSSLGKSENPLNGATHLVGKMSELWQISFPAYTRDEIHDSPACKNIADFIFKNANVKHGYGNTDEEIKVLNTFQLIADQVNRETFWSNKPLKTISSHIQEFYNKIKNPLNATGKSKSGNGQVDDNTLKRKLDARNPDRKQAGS